MMIAGLAVGQEQRTVLFTADFQAATAMDGWDGEEGTLVDSDPNGHALRIENANAGSSVLRRHALPVAEIAGSLVTVSARVKAENVSVPPKHWNGIKVMLVLEHAGGGRGHPQIKLSTGSFDWRNEQETLRVSADVVKATLVLGLEQVTGNVWFDDVRIVTGRLARVGKRQGTRFKGHTEPHLRGVMHGPKFDRENLRVLAQEWGANQIRWQLNWTPMKKATEWAQDLDAYDRWLNSVLPDCDRAMDACRELGLNVLLDLHTPPGGRGKGGVCHMFSDPAAADKLVDAWRRLATRYKGRDIIYAYDLINEPVEPRSGALTSWHDLAMRVGKAIREIDPDKPLLVEPGPWGSCHGFDQLTPLDLDRVIYSFHMYEPHQFTHQGVHGSPVGLSYPGSIDGIMWNKERLREAMLPAIDFQRDFNVHICVGEFSAIRWAPDNSAYRYLQDCIDLFEELSWDWTYHAYREWDGWSVEHGPDPKHHKPTAEPTDRKTLLLDWFCKNSRQQ